ncbi:hypothetical protein RBB56_18155 [Kineothrix sp. MB12-C1]|nr:hypothetical protein [Kineothrix sp. MB12-C1]WMC92711.1 hypothetical protein RBB56_18155 [Kineothrix sp. MB12-C1]
MSSSSPSSPIGFHPYTRCDESPLHTKEQYLAIAEKIRKEIPDTNGHYDGYLLSVSRERHLRMWEETIEVVKESEV